MDQDAIDLFHELADLSPTEREEYYARRQVPAALRAEVESLLRFDGPGGPSVGAYVISAADEVLLQGDGIPEVIAHYRITTLLGEGGMGKVYRAVDTKLGREVAIKVIPAAFAQDAGRMARFTREAKVLASLNHPNIAAIYGVEDRALVMELVEGPTLAERIAQGPVPLEEALDIARQMADALEAAHEKGVVHRDLKPANIKVNPEGIVKVLDFGLAVAQTSAGEMASSENSPTRTIPKTEAGVILGTAAYMPPEQARGKPVDKRADVWAFGVVLYEMLAGERLFDGETVADTLVAVLNREPDWNRAPVKVQRLLRACLEKDPKRRLQAIGDARLLLEDSQEAAAPRAKSRFAWAVVVAICAILAAIGWLRPQTGGGGATPNLALTILPQKDAAIGINRRAPVISPNGALIQWRGRNGLELRRLNSIHSETVRGTERVSNLSFWSPDSTSIAFPTTTALLKVRLPDGVPEPIAKLPLPLRGGTWSERGTILFATGESLYMVSAAGGEAARVEVPGLKGAMFGPEFLPGGEEFLVLYVAPNREDAGIYLVTLRAGKPADPVLVLKNDTAAHYSPASGGLLFFVRGDNLYAQKLDVKGRKLQGDPELVERDVASDLWFREAHFSVSKSGVVAWRPGRAALSQVTIFDRSGKTIGSAGPPGTFNYLRLSPDEARLLADDDVAHVLEPGRPGILTLREGLWRFWSPDGLRLIGQGSAGGLVERMSGGAAEVRQLTPGMGGFPQDISPDGKLVLHRNRDGSIVSVRLDGASGERAPQSVVQTNELIYTPRFSPDGRWIAYYAQSGQNENLGIYVQPFPGPGLRQQIANEGRYPVWSKDGKEILYLGPKDEIWSVPVNAAAGKLRLAPPQPLFPVRAPASLVLMFSPLEVSRDGSRIYFAQAVEQPDADLIHIRMGWNSAAGK